MFTSPDDLFLTYTANFFDLPGVQAWLKGKNDRVKNKKKYDGIPSAECIPVIKKL